MHTDIEQSSFPRRYLQLYIGYGFRRKCTLRYAVDTHTQTNTHEYKHLSVEESIDICRFTNVIINHVNVTISFFSLLIVVCVVHAILGNGLCLLRFVDYILRKTNLLLKTADWYQCDVEILTTHVWHFCCFSLSRSSLAHSKLVNRQAVNWYK